MQTQEILISVVIPLYNGADHIIKCLNNLDKQDCSFPYEVLVVDDCSTDNSAILVENHMQEMQHKDMFRLIRLPKNGRAGAARNIGVKSSRGDYVLFIDQDDYPDQKLLRILWEKSKEGAVDLVSCAVMDRGGEPYYRPEISADHLLTNEERNDIIRRYGYVFASLIKRSLLIDNKINFVENVMFEDCLYNAGVISCVETIQTIKDILYYRESSQNSQTSFFTAKKLNDRIDAVKIYLVNYYTNEKTKKYIAQIEILAFYYIYLSCMFWMLAIPKLYQKELFDKCLSEGKQLNVSWKEVFQYEKGFSKQVLHLLKLIYYAPFMAYPARFCGTTAYKILKAVKK